MAATFSTLVDSPMLRKELHTLEQTNDELKDRCQRLHKGCKKFTASLAEAYDGYMSLAQSLEAFGAAQEDPVSVSIGGPLMSGFTTLFKELGSYKEVLRSEVEHLLSNRLAQLINVDMQNVKDCRRRFDKATAGYDQAREKFMSLKKGARGDIVAELEVNLHTNKSAFERCRFNLVNALANIESKKKFEFLDIISALMDAHRQYFKKGYELFNQTEPLLQQVSAYIQKSKELVSVEKYNLEKRMQEYRAHSEHANVSSNNMDVTSRDGIRVMGFNSYKNIEALMQSTANGKVNIIKQGYLLKRSSNLRGDWQRRFFVLDSHGTLYYYSNKSKQQIFPFTPISCQTDGSHDYRTLDLLTSTIKKDAEQTDLRFCFRIISPVTTLTLQAENEADRMDWTEKITGVITSLLNSTLSKHFSMDSQSFSDAHGADAQLLEGCNNVSKILSNVPGNDACAECGASDPDWASLNLGIIMCIECSGVHRNLGVHISKVRSLTLDVKVWEPPVVNLLCALGNAFSNSVWEELLLFEDKRTDESNFSLQSIKKPTSNDAISRKEIYIHAKYVDKALIVREKNQSNLPPVTVRIWEAVKTNNVQTAYRLLVASDGCPNTKYDEVNSEFYHKADMPSESDISYTERNQLDPKLCGKIKDTSNADSCSDGCSLMHLACHFGNPVMLELLLQFGGDINSQDFHLRTPLHHCVSIKKSDLAKYLIRRGANVSIKDGGGLTALERAMEQAQATDDELVKLLANRS